MDLHQIIDKRIKIAVQLVDEDTGSQVSELWGTVNPSPSCPSAGELMKKINRICHQGLTNRGKAIQKAVTETLSGVEQKVDDEMATQIVEIAKMNFPDGTYVSFAKNTKGVYQRANAPKHKFQERVFDLEVSAITCGSANLSRRAINSLQTDLKALAIKNNINKDSSSQRTYQELMNQMSENGTAPNTLNTWTHLFSTLEHISENAPSSGYASVILKNVKRRIVRAKTDWAMLSTFIGLAALLAMYLLSNS